MERALSSDAQLIFAFGIAGAALASALLMLLTIAVLRLWRLWRQRRLEKRKGRWRDALHAATEDPSTALLPRIAALELPEFVLFWNHFQESLQGEVANNLAILLRLHGINDRLMAMLDRRSLRPRLIAITALGHLREGRAWDALAIHSQDPGPVISLAAARAMLRIDAPRALDLLMPSIVEREDWSLARIGSIFQELGPAVVTAPLVAMLASRPRHGLARALKLARFGHRGSIALIVHEWLSASDVPEVIVAALDYVESNEDLPWARGAARHSDWTVRMAAACALERIGGRRELAPLLELLRDPVWWVRFHAARSLTRLHGIELHELEILRENARDAYAWDMLGEALAGARRE